MPLLFTLKQAMFMLQDGRGLPIFMELLGEAQATKMQVDLMVL
jgi:hypothetical protein